MMDRFESKWGLDPATGCHVWTAATSGYTGYGKFYFRKKKELAHRAAYMIYVGDIPQGGYIDHICRNRLCVNPQHLEVVSNRENILRGDSAPAKNARKVICPGCGGDYTRQADGSRRCTACRQRNRKDTKRLGVGRAGERTECPRGHPYDHENTYLVKMPDGSIKQRACRECSRQRVRNRREKERLKGGGAQ